MFEVQQLEKTQNKKETNNSGLFAYLALVIVLTSANSSESLVTPSSKETNIENTIRLLVGLHVFVKKLHIT